MSRLSSDLYSTFSIVARDPETGQFGVAVQTHQVGVGRLVPWLLAGYGAIATQSLVNISFGPTGLSLLRNGFSAPDVIKALVAGDPNQHRRQVAAVDAEGRVGVHTGSGCIREAGHHAGEGYSVQANMMTRTTVIDAMWAAYDAAKGDLAERMMAALEAAQVEDGDIRGMQSAALKVVPAARDARVWETEYDLRVDEHETPLQELRRLVTIRGAQLLNEKGYAALDTGDTAMALDIFARARAKAPDQEELAYWQAVTLADKPALVDQAAAILRPVLADHPRRDHWLDLIGRLEECGLTEREGAATALLAALGG